MRDGITTKSGNSRYLKSVENFLSLYPNYEAFANALIAGTLPIDLNGINPAGWQQLGTELSKANLLSDETEAAIFGNAADRTVSQALAGLDRAANKLKLMAKYTVAGAYEWTCPEDGEYIALIIGGGGSGAIGFHTSDTVQKVSAGASGFWNVIKNSYLKNESVNLVVGAGGAAKTVTTKSSTTEAGNTGGSSSFDSVTANGGSGGSETGNGVSGAQYSSAYDLRVTHFPYGGTIVETGRANISDFGIGTPLFDIFIDENGLPVSMLCAGGGPHQTVDITMPNLKKGSPGIGDTSPTGNYVKSCNTPTDVGAGGGALRCYSGSTADSVNLSSGPGADGGVFIYKLTGGAA